MFCVYAEIFKNNLCIFLSIFNYYNKLWIEERKMEHLTFLSSTSTSLILSMSSELLLTTFDIAVSPSSDSWTSELAWRSAVFSFRLWRCLVDDVGGRVTQSTRPIRRNAMKRTADGILVVRILQSRITMMDSITDTVDTAIVAVTNTPLHTHAYTPNMLSPIASLCDRHTLKNNVNDLLAIHRFHRLSSARTIRYSVVVFIQPCGRKNK